MGPWLERRAAMTGVRGSTRALRALEMTRLIEFLERGGVSQAEFCRRHDLALSTLLC